MVETEKMCLSAAKIQTICTVKLAMMFSTAAMDRTICMVEKVMITLPAVKVTITSKAVQAMTR